MRRPHNVERQQSDSTLFFVCHSKKNQQEPNRFLPVTHKSSTFAKQNNEIKNTHDEIKNLLNHVAPM